MDSIDESRRSRRTAQALERGLCSWHANRASQRALPVDQWRHVETLHRASVGGLTLGDLPAGQWRALDEADRTRIFTGMP